MVHVKELLVQKKKKLEFQLVEKKKKKTRVSIG